MHQVDEHRIDDYDSLWLYIPCLSLSLLNNVIFSWKMTRDTFADDLDDGLEYDATLVAESDDEGHLISDSEQVDAPQNERAVEPAATSKKRKAGGSKLQQKKKMKMEMDINQKKNLSLESSPEAITDFVNTRIRHKNPDLSALELAELYFDKSAFRATGDYKETRTLDNLAPFITGKFDNMLPGKKAKKEKKNKKNSKKNQKEETNREVVEAESERKFVALLSMSALRACDIHRATRDLPGSSLKLINKNKIDVDLKLVKTTHSRVLCCTPGRLEKVLTTEDSGLQAEEIKIVILDNSYLDQKCQNIWDIKETLSVLKSLTKSGSKVYLY